MARLTKIYTRTGDGGTTRLGTGETVAKDDLQVDAYGTVDELNSTIGVVLAIGVVDEIADELRRIQNQLFDLSGELCMIPAADAEPAVKSFIGAPQVKALEESCDRFNAGLGDLQNFILPGGSPGAAQLHVARCVCRRAERRVVTFAGQRPLPAPVLSYLNRLSDLLFIMTRFENRQRGEEDVLWVPGA